MRRKVVVLLGVLGCGPGIMGDDPGGLLPSPDAGSGPDASRPNPGPRADAAPTSNTIPLDPGPGNSSGVKRDPQGRLILDSSGTAVPFSLIWVANSAEGTVSKIDTVTGKELGRYRTGPAGSDPSRTTVAIDGDVVVANRGGGSAVRIHANPATCPDKNGNGTVETSSGPADVLPWESDECVLWFRPFAHGSLPRAAAFDFVNDSYGLRSSSVWIGLWGTNKLVRLDAQTGEIVKEVSIPGHCPYGMAFGQGGNLWVFDSCRIKLLRLDTASYAWDTTDIGGRCAYGITVDSKGNVWTSGGNCVARYEPGTKTWSTKTVGSSNRGLAYDGKGSIWIADTQFGVHRVDATSMAVLADVRLNAGGFVGMAVDFNRKIWAISQSGSKAFRIEPDTLASQSFATGHYPYTYSDMTGLQLQNAAPPAGRYKSTVEGCGPETQWLELHWKATTAPGTHVAFQARTGNTAEELAAKGFVPIARQPSDVSPADLRAALEAKAPGSSFGRLLEIEMSLVSEKAGVSPIIEEVTVRSSCKNNGIE